MKFIRTAIGSYISLDKIIAFYWDGKNIGASVAFVPSSENRIILKKGITEEQIEAWIINELPKQIVEIEKPLDVCTAIFDRRAKALRLVDDLIDELKALVKEQREILTYPEGEISFYIHKFDKEGKLQDECFIFANALKKIHALIDKHFGTEE